VNEAELIERVRDKVWATRRSGVRVGIGDDCAVFRARGSEEDLLFTTDMVIEDVHFRRDTHPAAAVGYRVLARGLSDIAAMGGAPRFCLLSLAVAPWVDTRWLDRFYGGLLGLARRTGTVLAGGDLARARAVCCDIVVCGSLAHGGALRRDGARPGDAIYVSGRLGGSALGLERGRGAAWKRHLHPEPRLALGRFLRDRLRATAAMDLSDGLSLDLRRMCAASGVSAALDQAPPIFRGATLDQALHGGEDYELLFTLRPRVRPPATHGGIPLTRIGTIRKGKPGAVEFAGRPLEALGWDHFRNRK